MNEINFESIINGEIVSEKDENGNEIKVVKSITNLISIDLLP